MAPAEKGRDRLPEADLEHELGGWKTLAIVQRYAHLSPDHKGGALGCLMRRRTDTGTSIIEEARIGGIGVEKGNYSTGLVPGAGVEPA